MIVDKARIPMNKWTGGLTVLAIIVILLVSSCGSANHPPNIIKLKAVQEILSPLSSCQIECIASDLDGDGLRYNWAVGDGSLSGEGSTVTWKAPDAAGKYSILVKVTDNNGGQDTDSIILTVRSNNSPTITSLLTDADTKQFTPSGSCRIECHAKDPDGDELTFTWTASGGDIPDTGSIVNWTAPELVGTYNIAVVVTDGRGGEDTSSLNVTTAPPTPPQPPVIEDLIVTPKRHDLMKEKRTYWEGETYWSWWHIFKGKSCWLECIASDPNGDELSYSWSADGGELSGKGSVVTWTAPEERCEVVVTVTVSDGNGGITTESMRFSVETCLPMVK